MSSIVGDVYTPPPPRESGGTYAPSPSPEPPFLGKRILLPPILGIGYHIFPRLTPFPPSARKWEQAGGPLMHSSGGGAGYTPFPGIYPRGHYLRLVVLLYDVDSLVGKYFSGVAAPILPRGSQVLVQVIS